VLKIGLKYCRDRPSAVRTFATSRAHDDEVCNRAFPRGCHVAARPTLLLAIRAAPTAVPEARALLALSAPFMTASTGPTSGIRIRLEGVGVRSGPGEARTILLLHIISVRPSKQPLMVRTFFKVYMELGSYFLFLQEQIKDIIIIPSRTPPTSPALPETFLMCTTVESGVIADVPPATPATQASAGLVEGYPTRVCLLLQDLVQNCLCVGGGGYGRTCVCVYYCST
jgi:hypothetical protein